MRVTDSDSYQWPFGVIMPLTASCSVKGSEAIDDDPDNLFESINASSTQAAKQNAFAMILEEISRLRNRIREHEKQIAACKEKIKSWQIQQNKLADIGRLPEDVLLRIFTYFAHNAGSTLQSMKEWLRVTHACADWRRLSLNSPMLWRWPCILLPTQLVSLLLERKGTHAPLSLVVNRPAIQQLERSQSYFGHGYPPHNSRDASAMDLACQLVGRTRALRLINQAVHQASPAYHKFLSLLGEGRASELEYLAIEYPVTGSNDLDLPALVKGATQLRHINLTNSTLLDTPSRFPPSPQLTNLEVILKFGSAYQLSSLSQVLSTLRQTPNLKSLSLLHVFRPLEEEDVVYCETHPQPLSLATLESMEIHASAQVAQKFLDHVTCASTANLAFKDLWDDGGQFSTHLDSLRNLIITGCRRFYRSVKGLGVTPCGPRGTDYMITTAPSKDLKSSPSLKLQFPSKWDFICELPCLEVFEHLRFLSYKLDVSSVALWTAFGKLKHLDFLYLHLSQHPAFLRVLASFRRSGGSIFEPVFSHESPSSQRIVTVPSLYFKRLLYIRGRASDEERIANLEESLRRIILVRLAWRRTCLAGAHGRIYNISYEATKGTPSRSLDTSGIA